MCPAIQFHFVANYRSKPRIAYACEAFTCYSSGGGDFPAVSTRSGLCLAAYGTFHRYCPELREIVLYRADPVGLQLP